MPDEKVIRLFEAAGQKHEEERMGDHRERLVLVGFILGTLLFGVICFDLGFRVASSLCSHAG